MNTVRGGCFCLNMLEHMNRIENLLGNYSTHNIAPTIDQMINTFLCILNSGWMAGEFFESRIQKLVEH